MQVRIGRKRANDGLSVHLEIDGDTCNTLRPVIVEATREGATTKRCRSCWTPARIAAARELVEAAQDENVKMASSELRYTIENQLIALRQWFKTDAEKARHAELVARFRKPVMVAAPVIETKPAAVKQLSAFGAMRAANLKTHAQPIGRVAHVRKAA